MVKLFKRNPASWAAVIQAVVALVAVYVPDFPEAAVLTLIGAVTGLGFVAQKVEHGKTVAAYYTLPEEAVE